MNPSPSRYVPCWPSDSSLPPITWLVYGENRPPLPLFSGHGWPTYRVQRRNLQYPVSLSHGPVINLIGSHSSSFSSTTPPSSTSWKRVSWLLFGLSPSQYPFRFSCSLDLSSNSHLSILCLNHENIALEFGLYSHRKAYRLPITRTIWSEWIRAWWSLELVLILLAFDNKDQLPLPDHLENLLIWLDSIKVIPLGFVQYASWMSSRIS